MIQLYGMILDYIIVGAVMSRLFSSRAKVDADPEKCTQVEVESKFIYVK